LNNLFKTPYDGERGRSQFATEGESLTKQADKDRCDINRIVNGYRRTGLVAHTNTQQPTYGNATGVDFQSAMNLVIEAQESFMALPAAIRKKFGNDPAQFLEFTSDEANLEAMYDLGLAERPEAAPAVAVAVQEGGPSMPPAVEAPASSIGDE